jgi:hypothetical protein
MYCLRRYRQIEIGITGRVNIMKKFLPTSRCVRRYRDVTDRRTSVVTDPAQRTEKWSRYVSVWVG